MHCWGDMYAGVQRVALLQYGDDPWVEPGDQPVRVFIEEAGEDPPLQDWERDHEAHAGNCTAISPRRFPGPGT